MIGLLLALGCGRSAPPTAPVQPEVVAVVLGEVTSTGAVSLQLTAARPVTLRRLECGIWQDGVMLDTTQEDPEMALSVGAPTPLSLDFEGLRRGQGLESGPVQLTGSLHLAGALGSRELVTVDLSGAVGEVTP